MLAAINWGQLIRPRMTNSYFAPEPHGVTLAAAPTWPVPADTREPAAAVDEAISLAMAGGAPAPMPTPPKEAGVMPAFGKMTKTELLAYCTEQHPAGEETYLAMDKAQLVTEAEGIWTELYAPVPA